MRQAPDVLVLNQYYEPDVAVTGRHAATIARRLAREGLHVHAIVGQPSYQPRLDRAARREVEHGVLVERLPLPRGGRNRMHSRLAGYLAYLAGVAAAAPRLRPRVVVSFHNPPLLGLVAARIAGHSGASFLYVVQDIHPDIVVSTGLVRLPWPAVSAWDAANRHTLQRADRVVVLGEGMRRTLLDKGSAPGRTRVIPLWAEPDLPVLASDPQWRIAQGLPDAPLVVYAGNLGAMHQFAGVITALGRLPRGALELVVVGAGVRWAHWRARAAERPELNIRFLPFQRPDDYRAMLASCAATLVTLTPGMEALAVPSKAWSSLAAGRPVIAHMAPHADVAQLVSRTGAGWAASDEDALERAFRIVADDPAAVEAAGVAARAVYERDYTRDAVTGQYADLVRELLELR